MTVNVGGGGGPAAFIIIRRRTDRRCFHQLFTSSLFLILICCHLPSIGHAAQVSDIITCQRSYGLCEGTKFCHKETHIEGVASAVVRGCDHEFCLEKNEQGCFEVIKEAGKVSNVCCCNDKNLCNLAARPILHSPSLLDNIHQLMILLPLVILVLTNTNYAYP